MVLPGVGARGERDLKWTERSDVLVNPRNFRGRSVYYFQLVGDCQGKRG